ncbi:GTP pyrophosphokinase [Micromonospora cathayae]|uniref:RelA/SpoT domain-containing protein n=1 Tax=Micromonospora cathayae TaxID=3028804 RepID=A0ABY7ZPH7_9ACTN|nr:RelA/SpoT domain-containing protein [Micromonospora sp. HUAS 3]WDZ84904.1 RelA/SpoT domain-containing protein [Micromonospora sp. HUAS 3]
MSLHVDLVDEFIARYTKEYDFYEQAGRIAARELESTLQAAGIRSIVTYRAKSIDRLRDKCRQREQKKGKYQDVEKIFDDIVDLVGIRVALYFPAEQNQVDGIIRRLFTILGIKNFPESSALRNGKRFSGYSATHYRVQLREQDLNETDKRYAIARIEVQVASVLMHAWSEVEHDLVYKPLAGDLSEDELAILDQLNGLVLAGEIALERLQKAGEARVTNSGRKFANHYDLAVHLLGRVPEGLNRPVNDAGLGRVDLLFDLIALLNVDTPEQLSPYLGALHNDLETRPLAEQIIDAILAEKPDRYGAYQTIRQNRRAAFSDAKADSNGTATQIGSFLMHWIELEHLMRDIGPQLGLHRNLLPQGRHLRQSGLLPKEMVVEYDRIRQLRNHLVHGFEPASAVQLEEASQRLQEVTAEIRRRLENFKDGESGESQSTK